MTSYTSPDLIPWPDDYGAPADVPHDMQNMAKATQEALLDRAAVVAAQVNIPRASGWGSNTPVAYKTGQMVVLASHFQRSSGLAVVANTKYVVGTLPAGYRPSEVWRGPVMWADSGVWRAGFVEIIGDGTISWIPPAAFTLAVDDFVSVSGVVFRTGG